MNKHLYRIVFNAQRGMRMAVAETADSQGKTASGDIGSPGKASLVTPSTRLPVLGSLTAGASLVILCLLVASQLKAQVIADRTAPSNQQPTVLTTASGVPQVNIQTPSAAGVSRNTYSQFDIGTKGAILNNSRTDTSTQIGGFVQGNPWLASGSARVILNEVNSSNPSQLKGFVEVAGQRAEVIIANPAGIAVNGCGFLNASAVTLTTGNVVMNTGSLESFKVRGGMITIEGTGLDTSSADYTSILSRAVAVNAGIWAKDLQVITGANEISAANAASRIVTSTTAGTGAAPAFALDVAAIGGMYAGKIHLIGTEAGLGIRNAGTIGASTGDVTVSNDGWLSNSGTIQAKQQSQVQATQLTNTVTGAITSGDNTTLAITTQLDNRGLIDGSTARLSAQTINNTATGKIYGERISIQANTLNNAPDTIGGQAPTIASRSGNIDLGVGQLFNNEGALIYSSGNLAIAGNLDTNGKATARTSNITNNSATLEAQGNLDIQTASLKNSYDTLNYQVVVDKVVAGSSGCGADCYTVYDETHYKTEEIPGVNGPGKIISGANLTINASTSALNDRSQILAGNTLDITGASIENKGIDVSLNIEQRGTSHQRRTEKYWDWGWKERAWWEVNPYSNNIPDNQTVRFGVSQVSAKPNTGTSVPTASLYTNQPSPTSSYLIVTDPRFTNYRSWLGSDYFTTKLALDPTVTQKRLGDGFYEQRLINEQVAVLTGRRFLGGFTNDEQQYQALMDAGITSANAFNLRPGIALTAQQVAQLTSDIVWLEETTVTLADGSKQKVITPRVYLMPREGDLAANGALLGGAEVKLTSSGDINNSGTIQGRDLVSLDAKTINNIAGGVQADTVALKASEDINNLGGTIAAQSKLEAAAGRNLTVESSTRSNTNDSGVVKTSNQTVTRLAGLYVTKADGFLLASAGQDMNLIGAEVSSAGSASLNAGRDLNLQTVNTSKSFDATLNPDNYNRSSSSKDVGNSIQAAGNLSMTAAKDITAKAAMVSAGGALNVNAGNNIIVLAGEDKQSNSSASKSTNSSWFSSTTTTTQSSSASNKAIASTFSGQTTSIVADNNLISIGTEFKGTDSLLVEGKNEQKLYAAIDQSSSSSRTESSSSFIGINIGNSSNTNNQAQTTALGSKLISDKAIQVNVGNSAELSGAEITSSQTTFSNLDPKKPGTLTLGGATETTQTMRSSSSETAGVWQSQSGGGSTTQTLKQTTIHGGVTFDKDLQVAVQLPNVVNTSGKAPSANATSSSVTTINQASVQSQIETLSQQPGLGYLKQLMEGNAGTAANTAASTAPKVQWNQVQLAHDNWKYEQQGLTPAGAALLSIAVAAATGGMGAELLGGTTATAATATTAATSATLMGSTALGAAANAGFASLAAQASVAMVNNGGDIGRTLEQLGSSDTIKNMLIAMGTAGVGATVQGQGINAVLANTVTGCAAGAISSSGCEKGATTAAFVSTAGEAYQSLAGYEANAGPGVNRNGTNQTSQIFEPDGLGRQIPADQGMNVIGLNKPGSLLSQGGAISRGLNQIPFVNATAGLHDYIFNANRELDFTFWNVPMMVPAAALSTPAALNNLNFSWITQIKQPSSIKPQPVQSIIRLANPSPMTPAKPEEIQ